MLRNHRFGFGLFTLLAILISLFPPMSFTYHGNVYLGTETAFTTGPIPDKSTDRFAVNDSDYHEYQALARRVDSMISSTGFRRLTSFSVTDVIPYEINHDGGIRFIFSPKDVAGRSGDPFEPVPYSHYYVNGGMITVEYILAALTGLGLEVVLVFFRKKGAE